MSKRYLPALIVLFLLVTAAAGLIITIGADGRTPITRLKFEPLEHIPRIYGEVVPPVDHDYPDVVARVNDEKITGGDLMEREVRLEHERLSFEKIMEQMVLTDEELAPLMAQFEEADPLELLIEDTLLRQAVAREGMLGSRAEVEESLRLQEEKYMDDLASQDSEARADYKTLARLLGYPESDWPSDDRIVEYLRGQIGLTSLRKQECEEPPGSPLERDPVRQGRDCTAFLAAERAAADIEIYVRWAD